MIGLIRVFDREVSGSRLFQDWKIRRDRSMMLAQDLTALAQLVQNPAQTPPKLIVEQLKSFKTGSMQWLMYKDWQDYDALAQQVIDAVHKGEQPDDLLHRIGCYLETLLVHVKARSVLSETDPSDEVFPMTAALLQLQD